MGGEMRRVEKKMAIQQRPLRDRGLMRFGVRVTPQGVVRHGARYDPTPYLLLLGAYADRAQMVGDTQSYRRFVRFPGVPKGDYSYNIQQLAIYKQCCQ